MNYAPIQQFPIYTAQEIRQWEQRWFEQGNSSFGLMQQASLAMASQIMRIIYEAGLSSPKIVVCCGVGHNGGDGYLVARYLADHYSHLMIFAPFSPKTENTQRAKQHAMQSRIPILDSWVDHADVYVDALFGNGLDRALSTDFQEIIQKLNQKQGLKIAIDLPSGLHPDQAIALPIAVKADFTLCLLGLKMGLLTGQGRHYAGKIIPIPLIPIDLQLNSYAYLNAQKPYMAQRRADSHKGYFGHVLIIGGHQTMGGAVIMAAESAMACGVGKVTVMCHPTHHSAILSRSPNLMVKDIAEIEHESFADYLQQIDCVALGMGLGRDAWSQTIYQQAMQVLQRCSHLEIVLDADALYFLSIYPQKLSQRYILTPHSAEAGRLLNISATAIEQNRVQAIYQLQALYAGRWVLKGAGSLVLESVASLPDLSVCAFGNAAMASAGMGDILSGMIAGLRCHQWSVSDCVALHALVGEVLAIQEKIDYLQAHEIPKAIAKIIVSCRNKSLNENNTIY